MPAESVRLERFHHKKINIYLSLIFRIPEYIDVESCLLPFGAVDAVFGVDDDFVGQVGQGRRVDFFEYVVFG